MQKKANKKFFSEEMASLVLTSVLKQIIRKNAEKCYEKLEEYGKNLGTRIAEDFFMRGSLKGKIKYSEVTKILSSTFFPMYLEHTPNYNGCIIYMNNYLDKLYIKDKFSCLVFFSGLFNVICRNLSESPILIVINSYPVYCLEFRDKL